MVRRAVQIRLDKDAYRQQTRRDAMKARGKPDTHAVNRAISEAVSYRAVAHAEPGEHWAGVRVRVSDVLQTAANILAQRYDAEESARAVVERMKPRNGNRWTLKPPPRADDI